MCKTACWADCRCLGLGTIICCLFSICSGAPQVYSARPRGPTQMTPTQLIPRHVRPPLIPGAPLITTGTGSGTSLLGRPRPPHMLHPPPPPPALAAKPESSHPQPSSSSTAPHIATTAGEDSAKPSTSAGTSDANKNKKKKKKKKEEGEKKPRKFVRAAGGTVWEDPTLLDWDPSE